MSTSTVIFVFAASVPSEDKDAHEAPDELRLLVLLLGLRRRRHPEHRERTPEPDFFGKGTLK